MLAEKFALSREQIIHVCVAPYVLQDQLSPLAMGIMLYEYDSEFLHASSTISTNGNSFLSLFAFLDKNKSSKNMSTHEHKNLLQGCKFFPLRVDFNHLGQLD